MEDILLKLRPLWHRLFVTRMNKQHDFSDDQYLNGAYMKVEEKGGIVENKPRLMTRDLQPTYHECYLKMDYKLYAPEAAREFIRKFCIVLYRELYALLASS